MSCAFGLAALTATVASTAALATAPGENGRIVFTSEVGTHDQVFTVAADGSGLKQLTHFRDGSDAVNPSWSPDGSRIVFERDFPYPHAGLYTMNAEGGDLRSLTPNKKLFFEGVPVYSPDGKKILFDRQVCATADCKGPRDHNELWTRNANGTGARRINEPLLNGPQGNHYVDYPQFSPNGKRIAYVKRLGGKAAVFVVNANGRGTKRLTSFAKGVDQRVDWSPDGTQILFSDNERAVDVYTVRPDGTKLTQITHSSGANYSALSWSPDGKQILFILGHPSVSRVLYVMNADGSEQSQVTSRKSTQAGSWGTHP